MKVGKQGLKSILVLLDHFLLFVCQVPSLTFTVFMELKSWKINYNMVHKGGHLFYQLETCFNSLDTTEGIKNI